MKHINVDDDVYRELERLAAAWHTTVAGTIVRFVTLLDPGGRVPGGEPRQRPTPDAASGPDAGNRAEAMSDEEAVAESPAAGTSDVTWWVCRGCGTTYLDCDADMIADHVRGCELVDGAGNPLPGGAA